MKKFIILIIVSIVIYVSFALYYINTDSYTHLNISKKSLEITNNFYSNNYSSLRVPFVNFKDNLSYYISHPPLYYYLLTFSHTISNTYYPLILSILCSILTSAFIYLIVCILYNIKATKEISWIGLMASIFYIFSPTVLYFQTFQLHPDIFIQCFFTICTYTFLKLQIKNKFLVLKYKMLLFIILFLMCYSSWFGFLYIATIVGIGLFYMFYGYKMFSIIILCILVAFISSFTIYIQYSSSFGFLDTFISLFNIYKLQISINTNFFIEIFNFIKNIFYYNFIHLLFFCFLIVMYFSKSNPKIVFTKNGYKYLIISFAPLFLIAIFFSTYAQNTYIALYFTAPFCVINTVLFDKILFVSNFSVKKVMIFLLILSFNFIYSIYLLH